MQPRRARELFLLSVPGGQSLEGRNGLAGDAREWCHAGSGLDTVHEHRTRAALRKAAPEARSLQLEVVRKDIQERRVRRRVDVLYALIDGESRCHSSPPPPPILHPLALIPGTRLGVYEVTAQIGEGGMGQVYRATDTKLKRQVAIKILPQALAADHDRSLAAHCAWRDSTRRGRATVLRSGRRPELPN